MNKVILVVYFGNLPNYFELFLDSCRHNDDFDFIVFTDQSVSPQAANVRVVQMSFGELNDLVGTKLGHEYQIFSPYKLCDYKVTYGKLFEDYIGDYAAWGYCDTDMLLGRISSFIGDDVFETYDRLLINGHLTFYKNSQKVNDYYLLTSPQYISFAEAAKSKEPCFIDEIAMPGIMHEHGIAIYENWNFADILPQHFTMKVQEHGKAKNYSGQKFYYENGSVYQEFLDHGKQGIQEHLYIHLQKRTMDYSPATIDINQRIYINPNIFTNDRNETSPTNQTLYKLKYHYRQLKKLGNMNRIKIKMKILKDRIGRAR